MILLCNTFTEKLSSFYIMLNITLRGERFQLDHLLICKLAPDLESLLSTLSEDHASFDNERNGYVFSKVN